MEVKVFVPPAPSLLGLHRLDTSFLQKLSTLVTTAILRGQELCPLLDPAG